MAIMAQAMPKSFRSDTTAAPNSSPKERLYTVVYYGIGFVIEGRERRGEMRDTEMEMMISVFLFLS